MEIIGSLILSLTQSILFYGKQIGISMLIFEVVCNGIILFVLNKKEKIQTSIERIRFLHNLRNQMNFEYLF